MVVSGAENALPSNIGVVVLVSQAVVVEAAVVMPGAMGSPAEVSTGVLVGMLLVDPAVAVVSTMLFRRKVMAAISLVRLVTISLLITSIPSFLLICMYTFRAVRLLSKVATSSCSMLFSMTRSATLISSPATRCQIG